jgi:hypothetical protein
MSEKPKTMMNEDAMNGAQQPVAVILQDGSFYVGWITDMDSKTLTLTGQKGLGKIKKASIPRMEKAKISAFFPGNQTFNAAETGGWTDPFGFSPVREGPQIGGDGGTGWGGFMGFMKQAWPGIQIGMGIVRAVMPLMGGFKL